MTRKQPKDARMAEIIDAAVSEFLAKGYEGASMEAIAERAGLTKGGLYHHFAGKDEILRAANRRFFEPIEALIHQGDLAGSAQVAPENALEQRRVLLPTHGSDGIA
jgi:AcrR family transcriptional regulator